MLIRHAAHGARWSHITPSRYRLWWVARRRRHDDAAAAGWGHARGLMFTSPLAQWPAATPLRYATPRLSRFSSSLHAADFFTIRRTPFNTLSFLITPIFTIISPSYVHGFHVVGNTSPAHFSSMAYRDAASLYVVYTRRLDNIFAAMLTSRFAASLA